MMALLISEFLQICYFPLPPQAIGALKPHGSPPPTPPHTSPRFSSSGKLCHIYHLILETQLGRSRGGMIASRSPFQTMCRQTMLHRETQEESFRKRKETFTKSFHSFSFFLCSALSIATSSHAQSFQYALF